MHILKPNSEIYGRKIFFVCATFTLNTNIILRLMDQEFEIYKVDEYRQLKSLLQVNPDAIVYINADAQNSANVWFNFISYFEKEPQFSKVDFGVFGGKFKPAEKERYEKALKLKAGFYTLDRNFGDIMGELMVKLDDLKAKGIRKFVRMSCADSKTSEAYFVSGNMMYKMKLVDISSIGIGLQIPAKYGQIVKINSVLHGLTLVLGSRQLKVNAKIHGTKNLSDGYLAVLIFTPETPDEFRNYVRTYICEELQKKMIDSLLSLPWDKQDYTIEIKVDNELPGSKDSAVKEENKTETEEESTDSIPLETAPETADKTSTEEAEPVEEVEEAEPTENQQS